MSNINIEYTAVLPDEYVTELKKLASKKFIPSVNYGIKRAVEKYLEQVKKEVYSDVMEEADKDAAFLKRTLDTQKDFTVIDCEVGGEW